MVPIQNSIRPPSHRATQPVHQYTHLCSIYPFGLPIPQIITYDRLIGFDNLKYNYFNFIIFLFISIGKTNNFTFMSNQSLMRCHLLLSLIVIIILIYILKQFGQMDRTQQIISSLRGNFSEQVWNQLLNQLRSRGNQIAATQHNVISPHSISSYIRMENIKAQEGWFIKLNALITLLYEARKELLIVLYRSLPVLLQKYVQINYVKYEGLEECLIKIYNYQYKSYNYAQVEKTELSKDVAIRNLYESHLNKEMQQPNVEPLQQIIEISNTSRNTMKTLLFYLIYREAGRLGEESLIDYYRALFIYCGGDEKDINRTGSLYLLERTNKVSIFKYSISEQELEWIILTLYELCTQVKKDKFELLAVINAIHKKASNESMFRISDVASSLIHLLEDQYSEIFI